jgi:hypothetical protein
MIEVAQIGSAILVPVQAYMRLIQNPLDDG